MAAAVANLISTVVASRDYLISDGDAKRILHAADLVTLARTGVELDYRGDVIDAHAPEMPTRFAKQLVQIMRGALAIGMDAPEALKLALRCAQDSAPELRLAILRDLAAHGESRIMDIRRRLQRPRATADRALQALHCLRLLVCREEMEERGGKTFQARNYSLAPDVSPAVLNPPDTLSPPPTTHTPAAAIVPMEVIVAMARGRGVVFTLDPEHTLFTLEWRGPSTPMIECAISDNYEAVLAWLIREAEAQG